MATSTITSSSTSVRMTRDQLIEAGNEALFDLRSSRSRWNAQAEFFANKPVYKQRSPEPIIERQRGMTAEAWSYYYGK